MNSSTPSHKSGPPSARLDVRVSSADDRPVSGAQVELRSATGGVVKLTQQHGGYYYSARDLARGRCHVSVSAQGFEKQERELDLAPGDNLTVVVLGRAGLPFYYRGTVKVPFDPRPELVGVTLRRGAAAKDHDAFDSVVRGAGLVEERVSDAVTRDGMRVLRLPTPGDDQQARVLSELEKLSTVTAAGAVVSMRARGVSHLTREVVVKFKAHVSEERALAIVAQHGLEPLRALPYSPNTWHLRAGGPATYALLKVIDTLARHDDVEWAEPNLVTTAEPDAVNPADFLWNGVWDRQLVGTPDAWQALQDAGIPAYGDPNVIIAFVDQGLQSTGGVPAHPDFQGTVTSGADKVYRLFNFSSMVPNNDAPFGNHGMGVAGVGAARADNPAAVPGQTEGIAGAAPNCRVMGLMYPSGDVAVADMYIWAAGFDPHSPAAGFPAPISPGADVFSCSIGFGAGAPLSGTAAAMLDFVTTFGRNGKGCLCFFSTSNANADFTLLRPYAAYKKSFGITAATLADDGMTEIRAPYSGFGPAAALCAPSHDQYPVLHNPPARYGTWSADLVSSGNMIGHAAVQTTLSAAAAAGATSITVASVAGLAAGSRLFLELPGGAGAESVSVTGAPNPMTGSVPVSALLNAHAAGAPVASGPNNYTNVFGGTSSATPLTAGVAALVLSANPDLTWIEARQILRDTAIKLDPTNTDPIGQWLDANGNPSVGSGLPPVRSQWFGYGRIDAATAVTTAVGYVPTRDLVVRDRLSDVGAVPVSGAFWNSPDIWVRNASPVVEGAAALPANYATAGPHVNPVSGQSNWVYVRVRNNGTEASLDFFVRVSLTHFPGTEFTWPDSFIPSNRPGAAVPSPMVPGTYLIGELALSGVAAGSDEIVSVEWPAALIPPETVMVGGVNVHWHPCLLVEITPHDGPAPSGNHVWDSNNLAQKNLTIVYTDAGGEASVGAVVGHGDNPSELVVLEIDRRRVPREVTLYVDLLTPQLKRRLRKALGLPVLGSLGGFELPVVTLPHLPTRSPYNVKIGRHKGREVAFLESRGVSRMPVPAGRGALTPIVIGVVVGPNTPRGRYSLPVVQRNPRGELSGALELEIRVGERK